MENKSGAYEPRQKRADALAEQVAELSAENEALKKNREFYLGIIKKLVKAQLDNKGLLGMVLTEGESVHLSAVIMQLIREERDNDRDMLPVREL